MRLKILPRWLLTLLVSLPASQFADEITGAPGSTFKSACEYGYPPFSLVDEQGAASGFSIELLELASRRVGRSVDFHLDTWANIQQQFKQGDYDVLPLVGRTPEREAIYDFTFPYLSLNGAIVVQNQNEDIHLIEDLVGKRVAVMSGDNAQEYLQRTGLAIEEVATPTFKTALELLASGECDAVVIQRLLALQLIGKYNISGLKLIQKPLEDFRQDFCFGVQEGDNKTLALLNDGLSQLVEDGSLGRLEWKWFSNLQYPQKTKYILGTEADYPPYSMSDSEGNAVGFNVDLIKRLATEMDIEIEIKMSQWNDIKADLEVGNIDAIVGMYYNAEREKRFGFSTPFVRAHHAVFARSNSPDLKDEEDLKGKALVVMEGDIMHEYALKKQLSDNLILASTVRESVLLLTQGVADCALLAYLPALHWIKELEVENVRRVGPFLLDSEYSIAVQNGNTSLLHHLNEGLLGLEASGEINKLETKWFRVLDPESTLLRTVLIVSLIVVTLLLIIIVFALVWSRTLKKEVRAQTRSLVESRNALKSSEEKYRLLADFTYDWEHWLDPEGRYTYISPAFTRITGYSVQELNSRPELMFDIVRTDFRETLENHYTEDHTHTSGFMELEFPIINKQGDEIWIQHHCTPIYSESGDYLGRRGNNREITQRKSAERSLNDEKERLLVTLRSIGDGVIATDVSGNVVLINEVASALTGWSQDEGVGLPVEQVFNIINAENRLPIKSPVEKVLRTGKTIELARDTCLISRRGEEVMVADSGAPIRDAEHQIIGAVLVFRDITESLKLEKQILHSQKMESMGTLVGGISHELNNVLQSIFLFGGLIKKQNPNSTSIDALLKSAGKARDIVAQILTFSRQNNPKFSPLKLQDLIGETVKLLKLSLPENVKIEATLDNNCGRVLGDTTQISQILINLCNNAQHALGEQAGKIQITLAGIHGRIKPEDAEVEVVELKVADTGHGMDEKKMNRVFDPFFTTKEIGEGTGLGLSVVHGIVNRMGGDISIESEVGSGSTFRLRFPVIHKMSDTDSQTAIPNVPTANNTSVLLIDDNDEIRTGAQMLLKNLGYQVTGVSDGKHAQQLFESKPGNFDIVLTDYSMPSMTGAQLAEMIRASGSQVPIILSSGHLGIKSRKELIKNGITDFIQKPWNAIELMDKIEGVLATNTSANEN